ncbi:MAG: MFS transporter [Candidatus Schekmanbacteria bacterium]|nr:MFS transporter [Candidatus Schekmanbacteria bacterium]
MAVACIQFVNILDFVMVMPLGPDFCEALGIPTSDLGLLAGSYTLAAAIAGVIGSLVLERFDRKKAVLCALIGLSVATAAAALATGKLSLLLARVLAGAFGGPATALSYAIVADVVPAGRRGRAIGTIMMAFSVAAVLGVPVGLEAARLAGWRAPFVGTAFLGAVTVLFAARVLPSLRDHLAAPGAGGPGVRGMVSLLRAPLVRSSFAMTAFTLCSVFLIIPNISAYVQENLGFPREHLGLLYLGGGIASFASLRKAGGLVDRYGATKVGTAGACVLMATIYAGFGIFPPLIPAPVIFVLFMLSSAFRNVAHTTLTSKVPGPAERARFLSLQSTVQHLSTSTGAILSTHVLAVGGDRKLVHMDRLALVSISLCAFLPVLFYRVERRLPKADPAPSV